MGRIRKNVNWTAKITRGETGTTGFSIVGRKNPILVHVGKTDSWRDATVRFKQCETQVGEEGPKWDDCEIIQKASRKFVLRYLDYRKDTHERSDGAEVRFSDSEGTELAVVIVQNGEAEYVDRTGTLDSVYAQVIDTREFKDYLGLVVTDNEVYQVGELVNGVRKGKTNADYLQTVSAWTKYDIEYDNNSGVEITASTTLHMYKKSETKAPKYSSVGDNIQTQGKKIVFRRNGIDETLNETVFADSSVVVSGENDDRETVVFKAPKRVRVKYDTDYKRYDNPEDGISGVTSTMFNQESFTTDLYDPEVFTYVAKDKTPVDHEITLDYRYNENVFATETIEIKAPKDDADNITDWATFSAITGRHEIVVIYNDDTTIDENHKLDVVTHVSNEDAWRFNSYCLEDTSHGGTLQVRVPNEKNAKWTQEHYSLEGNYFNRCNPGLIRKTNCPENSLKIFSCKIPSSSSTVPSDVKVTTDSKWCDMYFCSNTIGASPSNNYQDALGSVAFIIPSSGVSEMKLYTSKGTGFRYNTFLDVNPTERTLSTLYTDVMDSDLWPLLQDADAEDYPQFGYMRERNSKYIMFASKNKRNIVIVSRYSGASTDDKIEQSVSSGFRYPDNVTPLADIDASVLFTVEGDELVPNGDVWDGSDEELEHCKNMIMAVYKKNSETKIINPNQNNQIIGFIFNFNLIDQEELNGYNVEEAKLNPNKPESAITEYLVEPRFISRVSEPESQWHAKKDDPVDITDTVSGLTDWVGIEPILFTQDMEDTGISCVLNIEDGSLSSQKLRYAFQLEGENGRMRYGRSGYKNKWDEIKIWKAINMSVQPNNSSGIRRVRINLINKDRFHYDRFSFIQKIQPIYPTPTSYPYYDDGENVRFVTRFDIIQLGSETTQQDLAEYVCSNKTEFLYKFPNTFYGIFLTKDNKIVGPKKFDFANYTFNPLFERLTFSIPEGGNAKITFKRKTGTNGKLEFAYDSNYTTAVTWYDTSITTNSAATLSGSNRMVTFSGTLKPGSNDTGIGTFEISGNCQVSGSVMSLLYTDERAHTNFGGERNYVFKNLFSGCTGLTDASDLYLPSASVIEGCYQGMFKGCTSLVNPPMLQAWGSADNCYDGMYSGCTSLNGIYVMTKEDPASTGVWNGISASGGKVTRNSKSTWTTIPQDMIENGWTVVEENSGRT